MASVRSPFRVVLGFLFILKIHGLTGSLHKNISASVNSDAELIWIYQLGAGVTPLFESWQKLPEIGIASRTTVAVYTAMLYEGRIELFGQAGLQLKNVTLSDTGVYQLFTVFSDGTSQTNNISVQVIDPCEVNDCAPAVAVCVPEGFNFSCRCNSGYEGDGRICVDVNECATIPNLCAGRECTNTKGGYMCTCPNGFVINADGTKCIDINECASFDGNICVNGECINLPGTFKCMCDMGYELDKSGGNCTDQDECALKEKCLNGMCTNFPGGYACDCPHNFVSNSAGTGCVDPRKGHCYSDYQEQGDLDICAHEVATDISRATCCCSLGQAWGDPCEPCPPVNSTERTTLCPGGPGFKPNNITVILEDINECVELVGLCQGGMCINTFGSFSCECPHGFTLDRDSRTCNDIDECLIDPTVCGAGTCLNTIGMYTCVCPSGHMAIDGGLSCTDMRESFCYAMVREGQCQNATSFNLTERSCCCSVGAGWGETCITCPVEGTDAFTQLCGSDVVVGEYSPSRGEVTDTGRKPTYPGPIYIPYTRPEIPKNYAKWCQVISDLCKNGICINTQGGYRCECPKGFQLSSDSRTCEDDSRIVLEDSGVTVAIDGRSVELHWSYRLGSNLVVFEAWYHQRNGREEMIAFRNHPLNISVSSKYEGRVKAFGDADLLLEGVSPADDGTYQLMAAFRNVTSQRKCRTLVVYYPPTTIDVPPNLNATEGDQVTIQAHANGVPPPTYVWEKVNGSLPSNSVISATTGALKLLNATLQDSGEYRVTASNQLGNVSDVTILTILTVEIRMPLVPEPYIIQHNRAMSPSREEDTPPVEEGTPPVEEDTPTVEEETPTPPVKEVMNDTEKGNLNPNADLGGTPGLTTLHVVLIAVVPSVMLLVLGVVAGILGNRWSRKRQSDDLGIEDFKEFDFHPDILELRDLHKPPPPLPPPVPARPQFLEYEVNPTDLRLNEQIGRGAFGIVFIATLKRAVNGLLTEQTVVVKTVQEDAGEEEVKNFIREVDTTINLRQHINLLGLVGCCTLSRPPYLVTEYMPYGDLKKFLLNCRKLEERLQDSMYDFDEMKIYQVARQIANGMTYISQAGYVHGDLAARNVLVGEDLVVKIADFGLATDIYERGYRRQDAEQKIPLRWMAPERLLREGRYTSKSDVWSFGVVLYEIATLGNVPYPGRERTLLEELSTGYREPRPPGLKQELYDMMLRCWQWEEDDRPEFEHLYDELDAVVEVMAKDYVKPGSGSPVGGQNEAAEAAETSYDVPKSARMGTQLKVTADVYNSEDNDKVDSLALASSNVESSSTPTERDVDTHNDIHTAVNNCRAMQQDALLESEDHNHLQAESSIPPGAVIMDTNDSFTDSELPLLTNVRTDDTQTLIEKNSLDAEDEMLMSPTPEEIVH